MTSINMVGKCMTEDFSPSGSFGALEVIDPPVIEQKTRAGARRLQRRGPTQVRRASARTAPWRMLTEADSTCGYGPGSEHGSRAMRSPRQLQHSCELRCCRRPRRRVHYRGVARGKPQLLLTQPRGKEHGLIRKDGALRQAGSAARLLSSAKAGDPCLEPWICVPI